MLPTAITAIDNLPITVKKDGSITSCHSTTMEAATMAQAEASLSTFQENSTEGQSQTHNNNNNAEESESVNINTNNSQAQPPNHSMKHQESPVSASGKDNMKDSSTTTFTTAASTNTNGSSNNNNSCNNNNNNNSYDATATNNKSNVNSAQSDHSPRRPRRVLSDQTDPREQQMQEILDEEDANNNDDGDWYYDAAPQRPKRVISGDKMPGQHSARNKNPSLQSIDEPASRGSSYDSNDGRQRPRTRRGRVNKGDSANNVSGSSNHSSGRVSRKERIRQRSVSANKAVLANDKNDRPRRRMTNSRMPPKMRSAPDVPPTQVEEQTNSRFRVGGRMPPRARSAPDVPVCPQRRASFLEDGSQPDIMDVPVQPANRIRAQKRPSWDDVCGDSPVLPQRQTTNDSASTNSSTQLSSDIPRRPERKITAELPDVPRCPQRKATNESLSSSDNSSGGRRAGRRRTFARRNNSNNTNDVDHQVKAAMLAKRQQEAEARLQRKSTRTAAQAQNKMPVVTDGVQMPQRQVTKDLKQIIQERNSTRGADAPVAPPGQDPADWENSWWSHEDHDESMSAHHDSYHRVDDFTLDPTGDTARGVDRMDSSLSSGILFVQDRLSTSTEPYVKEDGVPADHLLAPPRRTSTKDSSVLTPIRSRVRSFGSTTEEEDDVNDNSNSHLQQQPSSDRSSFADSTILSDADNSETMEEMIPTDTLPHQPSRRVSDDSKLWDSNASSIGNSFGCDGDDSFAAEAEHQRRPPAAPKRQKSSEPIHPVETPHLREQNDAPYSRFSRNASSGNNLSGLGDRGRQKSDSLSQTIHGSGMGDGSRLHRDSLSQTIHGSSAGRKVDNNSLLSASEHGRSRLGVRRDVHRGATALKQAAASVNRPGIKVENVESDPLTEFEQLKRLNETTAMSLETQLGGYEKLSAVHEDAHLAMEDDSKLGRMDEHSIAEELEKLKLQQEGFAVADDIHHLLNLDEQDDLIAKALADAQKIAMLHCGDSDPSILFQASTTSMFGDDGNVSDQKLQSPKTTSKVIGASSAEKELEELKNLQISMNDINDKRTSAAAEELEELKRMMDGDSPEQLDLDEDDDLVAKALADARQLELLSCGDSDPPLGLNAS